jgi:WD40 repeat protein
MTLSFSPTEPTLLAVGGLDRNITFWNLGRDNGKKDPLPLDEQASSIAFLPDGELAVGSGSYSNYLLGMPRGKDAVSIWDMATRRHRSLPALRVSDGSLRPSAAYGPVTRIALSPKAPLLAVGGYDGSVYLWNVKKNQASLLIQYRDRVSALTFSPDGTRLAVATPSQNVKLLDIAHRVELASFDVRDTTYLAFSDTMLVASTDKGLLKVFRIHPGRVHK